VGAARCGACHHTELAGTDFAGIDVVGKGAVLAAALLLGAFLCPAAGAQSAIPAAKPATNAANQTNAARRNTPATPEEPATPADANAPRRQAKKIDLGRMDPAKIGWEVAMQADFEKEDRKLPNTWIALGLLELKGGNLAGGKASLEYAMALGERRRNKAAVARAARLLGVMHSISLGFLRVEASGVSAFGSRPDDETTGAIRGHFESAKALFEKATALHEALGRKDGMAANHAELGELYTRVEDYEQARAAIEQALALNKAGQDKKQMAANYRALAATHRYDLDRAAVLLKEAITLHEELDLKDELATDYAKLAANSKSRGEPHEAERLYEQALALAPKSHRVSLLRNLAGLYADRNEPGRSHAMEQEARTLAREVAKETGSGGRLIFDDDLGLWVNSSSAKTQVESLEKVVSMERILGSRIGLATSYILLGYHYDGRADIYEDRRAELQSQAEDMFKRAVALNKRLERDEAAAHAYRELALILNKRGKLDEVQATLKELLGLQTKLGQKAGMARLYWQLGYGRQKQADKAQACAFWRQGMIEHPKDDRLADTFKRDCAPAQLAAPTAKPAAEAAKPMGQTAAEKGPPPAAEGAATATGVEAPPKQAITAAKPIGQAAVAEKGPPPAAKDATTGTGAEAPPKQAMTAAKPIGQAAVAEKGPPPPVKDATTGTGVEAPSTQAEKTDIASMDPLQISAAAAMRAHISKDDRNLPNAWIALGFVEARGGNLAGAEASLEQAMTLGEQQRNEVAVVAAALLLGRTHSVGLNFMRVEAKAAASFKKLGEQLRNKPADDRPDDDDLTSYISRQYTRIKALNEKAIALTKALDRKDGMADAYAQSGEFYTSSGEYEQARAAIGEALALNKALQRKKQLAANYRALAATHREPDQAATLLKQAIALNEALGLTKELAEDYERLGAVSKSRGEPHEAVRLYKQALALIPRKADQGSLLRNLGRVYRDLNDPGLVGQMEAEASAADEARLADGGGKILYLSTSLGMWMSSVAAKAQIESLEKAVPVEKALDNQIGLATTYALLGMHYAQRAEIDTDRRTELQVQAEAMLNDALALNARLKREKAVAHAYGQLVELYSKRGNPDQASKSLAHVVALYRTWGDKGSIARLYAALGHESKNQDDTEQACAYWRQGSVEIPDDKMLADTFNRECYATR
jgi:tetratricopeptide (TPR) repeat protein